MGEWIYAITNLTFPIFTKIGLTEIFPQKLLLKLDSSGATPLPSKLSYKIWLKRDYQFIMNSIRKELWKRSENVGSGWFRVSEIEALPIIRTAIAMHIVGKYQYEIRGSHGEDDLLTLRCIANSVLDLNRDQHPDYNVSIFEELQILRVVANKLSFPIACCKELAQLTSSLVVQEITQ